MSPIVRFLFPTLCLTLASASTFFTLRPDGFAPNAVSFLTNGSASATLQSTLLLPDQSILAAGTITLAPDVISLPHVVNDPLLPRLENTSVTRTATLLLRLSSTATLLWAVRTVPCAPAASFSIATDNTTIYLAGSTTAAFPSTSSSVPNNATFTAGALIAAFSLGGDRLSLAVHHLPAFSYTAIFVPTRYPDILLLVCAAPPGASVFATNTANTPTSGGLCISRVNRADLSPLAIHPLSTWSTSSATGSNSGATLDSDTFWHATLSTDQTIIFVSGRRRLRTAAGFLTSLPVMFASHSDTLGMAADTHNPPDALQNHVRLTPHTSGDVLVAYIARTNNRETITIRRFSSALKPRTWSGANVPANSNKDPAWKYRIIQDLFYTRLSRAEVQAVNIDDAGTVRLVLDSAELIDKDADNAAAMKRLTQGRPAVVEIASDGNTARISQSASLERWKPQAAVLGPIGDSGQRNLIIVGEDQGIGFFSPLRTRPRPLMTGMRLREMQSPSPSPIRSNGNGGGSDGEGLDIGNGGLGSTNNGSDSGGSGGNGTSGTQTNDNGGCVGVSTIVNGRRFVGMVQSNPMLRLQVHPRLGWGWRSGSGVGRVLCLEWNKGEVHAYNRVCLTPHHVMRWGGRLRYMWQVCQEVRCFEKVERVVAFKGRCGTEMRVGGDGGPMPIAVAITMHAGRDGQAAEEAVARECWLQRRAWWLWRMVTL